MAMSELSIAFTGDITFARYFTAVVSEAALLDESVSDFLKSADHCIGNIEGAVTHIEDASAREFRHHSEACYAPMIRGMGIDIWSIANNHALDFGLDGIAETYRNAEAVGCSVTGVCLAEETPKPLILPDAGGIGIISVTYSEKAMKSFAGHYTDWTARELISKRIQEVKLQNRWCVVLAHGGEEFSDMPTPMTRAIYRDYLAMGADIVVGHHPHTVQNYEICDDKIIFYSLGNFIFDTDYQRAQVHTDTGELLCIRFTETGYTWTSCPILINREENRIEKCSDPPVFVNMDSETYKKLWPYAAVGLSKAERNIVKYLNPKKYGNFSKMTWFALDHRAIKDKTQRQMLLGKYAGGVKTLLHRREDRAMMEYLMHL